jgi:hypothetical protein
MFLRSYHRTIHAAHVITMQESANVLSFQDINAIDKMLNRRPKTNWALEGFDFKLVESTIVKAVAQ